MRIVLLIVGSLAALYAIGGAVQFIGALTSENAGTTYGGTRIAANVVPVCLGLVVSLACFGRAFRDQR